MPKKMDLRKLLFKYQQFIHCHVSGDDWEQLLGSIKILF